MRRIAKLPPVGRLRELLDYDSATGVFVRKIGWYGRSAGAVAGATNKRGYRQIRVDGSLYYAHRLAWLYVYNADPAGGLDHINGDIADNRITNLRPATQSQNNANRRRSACNTSGRKGVFPVPSGRYVARIKNNGKQRYLGTFDTVEDAHAAYLTAARSLFGEFANAG
jgi:hypothetical protein